MSKGLSLARVFERIDYTPHPIQQQVHAAMATSRFRVVCAGRRTGKSTLGGHELVPRAYEAYFKQNELSKNGKRMEYWIIGPEYSDAEKEFRVLYNDLSKLEMPFDKPGTYNDVLGGNMHISLWNGRFQVHAKSAKYPENLIGEGLHGVVLAEAAKLKPSIWYKYVRPMLADYHGWALLTSTPEGKNWFYDTYMNSVKGIDDWWSIRMPSWSNPIVFPKGRVDPEILSMEQELTEEAFNQEIGADFTEFVGRVFKNFDEDLHCRRMRRNPAWPVYAAVDYGWTNPFVWLLLQVDAWDNIYVLNEYYDTHVRVDEVADALRSRGLAPPDLRYFYPDPAEPGDTAIIESALRIKGMGGTGGELRDRLRLIRKWLDVPKSIQYLPQGHKERLPKLFIDPVNCPNLVREMNDYRYPDNRSEKNEHEMPLKKDDHTPEALGRFIAGHFGKAEAGGRTRIRGSKISG